ncbi:hypothetical protein FLAN108750_03320 [Flavobacterium antarcticum]
MKRFELEEINIFKLYIFSIIGLFLYVLIVILSCLLIINLIPTFDYFGILIIVTALISGNFIFKISEQKSTTLIYIEIEQKKIFLDKKTLIIENLKEITIKKKLSHYPMIFFKFQDNKSFKYRIVKYSKDYFEFIKTIEKSKFFK